MFKPHFIFFSILLSIPSSYSQAIELFYDKDPKAAVAIENDINATLSDTVEESGITVKVLRDRNKPVISCSVSQSKSIENSTVAKCDITFKANNHGEKCNPSCFIIYVWKNDDLKSIRANDKTESNCIEDLSSACY